jgi:hypothetical protein
MASLSPLLRPTSSTIRKRRRDDLSELPVLSLPEEKRTSIYARSSFLATLPPYLAAWGLPS